MTGTDEPTSVRVTGFDREDDAREAASSLLVAGVTPLVRELQGPDGQRSWSVAVFPTDYERACEVLGVEPRRDERGEVDATDEGEWQPVEVKRWPPDPEHFTRFIALYVVLLVVVTGLVFLATVWLLGGFDEREEFDPADRTPPASVD